MPTSMHGNGMQIQVAVMTSKEEKDAEALALFLAIGLTDVSAK